MGFLFLSQQENSINLFQTGLQSQLQKLVQPQINSLKKNMGKLETQIMALSITKTKRKKLLIRTQPLTQKTLEPNLDKNDQSIQLSHICRLFHQVNWKEESRYNLQRSSRYI